MCFTKMAEKLIKKMKWYDIPLLKGAVLFSVLFLITVWPALLEAILKVSWYWYLIIAVILMIPLLKKMFSK